MTLAQEGRKYWENNLRKYKQRVINQKRLEYKVRDVDKSDYSRAAAYLEVLHQDPCAYCGASGADDVDHIVPLDLTGRKGNLWDNLTSSCKRCNGMKHSHSLLTFLDMRRCNDVQKN